MKHCDITIVSKNKKALETFVRFFNHNLQFNFNTINKYFRKKKRTKILTILKSPHVNKNAQEQFEYRIFSKQFTVYALKNYKYLLFLKKVKSIFSDVKIVIKFINNSSLIKKKQTYVFNSNNFSLELLNNVDYQNKTLQKNNIKSVDKKRKNLLKVKQYIKAVDIYGETSNA